ncbi:response regulator transcription factor [Calycomorphotria hydatis]|uniref:Transcriptional activator protein CzcR n=1 Tax=Calycomorphotria hydatis TaxID=2528027 RepID=A0A517TE38_9PLAN|nr:response regulator transcription factor [Calycomorphotria hydatis]QDT66635.1 Transcriptional activator protein CzcR [Calycomorphotria hydatis]
MSGRVLVIEDEDRIADFLLRGLREVGFVVEHAANGQRGCELLQTNRWDIVLLDWWLPVLDGLQVLKYFRQYDHTTPVLFLTAKDAISDRVEGLDYGANDYLCKPFAFEELLARMRALMRSRHQGTTLLSHSGVTLDLAANRVERNSQPIELTSKEFSLLAFFLRHPGEVLSQTKIYEHVWGDQYDGMSNTLPVHIRELRRKLEAHGSRIIHTLRGRGYQLRDSVESDT